MTRLLGAENASLKAEIAVLKAGKGKVLDGAKNANRGNLPSHQGKGTVPK